MEPISTSRRIKLPVLLLLLRFIEHKTQAARFTVLCGGQGSALLELSSQHEVYSQSHALHGSYKSTSHLKMYPERLHMASHPSVSLPTRGIVIYLEIIQS